MPVHPLLLLLAAAPATAANFDLVVYGGASAGVAAAVQAARMGKSVVLVEPGRHLGGLTSGGLGYTDSGDKSVVGGVAREFYRRVKAHYHRPDAWPHQPRDQFRGHKPDGDAMWVFEPKVAEAILRGWLAELTVPVEYGQRLDGERGVKLDGKRIVSFTCEGGRTFAGRVFLDCTYEGDLMAAAGVGSVVGREPNSRYGETLNGAARRWNTHNHRFLKKVDPFVVPGDKSSGLLPLIQPAPPPADDEGDHRLQAYCFRMCMTDVPANRVPWPKPAGYDERRYELLLRNFEAGDHLVPMKVDHMPNGKTDTNNNHAVSTDHIGANYRYPDGSYAERERIVADHVSYQQGLMWTLANHPRVPAAVRREVGRWGLARDEFPDTGHWGHQLYIREARRMVGESVQTEADCRRTRDTPMAVGMGSYNMDSHNCSRFVTPDGSVQDEGDVQESPGGPYRIGYHALTPKRGECPNLLVPVCLSSSHAAYGSIRMEPVFFVLGQSAATAAVLALDAGRAVQDVDYPTLRGRLLADGQVLDKAVPPRPAGVDRATLAGVVVDDEEAERVGFEATSTSVGGYVDIGYRHDGGAKDGQQSATFTAKLPAAGRYEVRLKSTPSANRATNVPVSTTHAAGTTLVRVNQRTPGDGWASLGTFEFAAGPATVRVTNAGADGHVVIDAVQWRPAGE